MSCTYAYKRGLFNPQRDTANQSSEYRVGVLLVWFKEYIAVFGFSSALDFHGNNVVFFH